jgi:hypothetical protein
MATDNDNAGSKVESELRNTTGTPLTALGGQSEEAVDRAVGEEILAASFNSGI